MTIETASGPPDQRASRSAEPADEAGGAAAAPAGQLGAGRPGAEQPGAEQPGVGRLWRSTARRAVLVPLVVLSPLIALAPTADHRYNVYWHGGEIRHNPWELIAYSWRTIPLYFDNGNFRPLGRMVEGGVDLASFLLMDFLGLPANIALRTVSFLAAMVLTLVAVIFAESVVARGRLFAAAPSRLSAAVPFAVGACFIAAGGTSTTILFGGLYWLTAALVLAVAALLCRTTRVTRSTAAFAVLAGAGLAAFNEMAYLALPLAAVAVLIRGRWILGLTGRALMRSAAVRLTGLLWLGFLPVFVPVRVMIALHCADNACYRGSDLAVGVPALAALPNRMLSWLPPLMWRTATNGTDGDWLAGAVTLAAAVLLAVLAWRAWTDLPQLAPVDRRQGLVLSGVAFFLLLLGSALAALNVEVQGRVADGRWGDGWRDSAITGVGGPLLVLGLVFALLRVRQRLLTGLLVVLLAVVATVSTAANKGWRDATADNKSAILNNAIAHEVADFDRSGAGNARRCELREQFRAMYQDGSAPAKDTNEYPGQRSPLGRLDATVDTATKQLYGTRFCRGGQP